MTDNIQTSGDEVPVGSPQSGEDTCPACAGIGKIGTQPCDQCGGSGIITVLVGDA